MLMGRIAPALVLLLAGCASVEDRLVYFPTRSRPRDVPLPPPLQDVRFPLADRVSIHGRWCPRHDANCVVLYCHGNAGNIEGRGRLAHDFSSRLNASVLLFDYPGYGESEAKPSEAGCYASAQAAFNWLTREK